MEDKYFGAYKGNLIQIVESPMEVQQLQTEGWSDLDPFDTPDNTYECIMYKNDDEFVVRSDVHVPQMIEQGWTTVSPEDALKIEAQNKKTTVDANAQNEGGASVENEDATHSPDYSFSQSNNGQSSWTNNKTSKSRKIE